MSEACAHSRVTYQTRRSKVDGATFGWWGCDLCGREFVEERLREFKREVERRDELLAGTDADLKDERAKTAALRALLEECEQHVRSWGSHPETKALLERIQKELGK